MFVQRESEYAVGFQVGDAKVAAVYLRGCGRVAITTGSFRVGVWMRVYSGEYAAGAENLVAAREANPIVVVAASAAGLPASEHYEREYQEYTFSAQLSGGSTTRLTGRLDDIIAYEVAP